jgi:hypothetical protein
VYLAGDGISWTGGWVEGAIETGLNAAAAVVTRLIRLAGTGDFTSTSPLLKNDENLYNYFGTQNPGVPLSTPGYFGKCARLAEQKEPKNGVTAVPGKKRARTK